MVGAVGEDDFEIDDREARLRPCFECVVDALLNGGDVFLRNIAAFDFIDEFVAAAGLLRFEREDDRSCIQVRVFLLNRKHPS